MSTCLTCNKKTAVIGTTCETCVHEFLHRRIMEWSGENMPTFTPEMVPGIMFALAIDSEIQEAWEALREHVTETVRSSDSF